MLLLLRGISSCISMWVQVQVQWLGVGCEHLCVCVKERERDLIRGLLPPETSSIKQEGDRVELHRLSIAVSIHKFLQLGASLDSKEDFITILQDLPKGQCIHKITSCIQPNSRWKTISYGRPGRVNMFL